MSFSLNNFQKVRIIGSLESLGSFGSFGSLGRYDNLGSLGSFGCLGSFGILGCLVSLAKYDQQLTKWMFNFDFVWELGSLALNDHRKYICQTHSIFGPNSLYQSA